MLHFQSGRLTQVITSSCTPRQELWASLCVNTHGCGATEIPHIQYPFHVYSQQDAFLKGPSRTQNKATSLQIQLLRLGEGSGKSNILLSSSLWPTCSRGEDNQNQQLLSKASEQWSQVLEEGNSVHHQAALLLSDCPQGNHCRISLQDKADT